jgi:hypothetical protein
MGRFTAGFLAFLAALPVTIGLARLASRALRLDGRDLLEIFIATACGFIWLAEKYGLVEDPYRDSKDPYLTLKQDDVTASRTRP